ncbi:MAG: hypothetical protein KatS3mg104_0639 [Phycisphaerae bacterium]|jgi:hypothetical protein|nr:MAG: hypothetical protein KatS3mg104_0639 [Phycisphaerae bacterium]
MKHLLTICLTTFGLGSTYTFAHVGPRIWVDVNTEGQIVTLKGPLGGAGAYPPDQFSPSRVFTRDMGDPSDDDLTENYITEFPGYERTQHPTTSFSGTVYFDITGEVLYYNPSVPTGFVPVSIQYPTGTPFFRVSSAIGTSYYDSGTGFVSGGIAFNVGSHGHPQYILQTPSPYTYTNGPDLYDGVYALPLRLRLGSYTPSDTFYLLLGRNASSETLGNAEVAMNSLVPEPSFVGLMISAAPFLLRRKVRR